MPHAGAGVHDSWPGTPVGDRSQARADLNSVIRRTNHARDHTGRASGNPSRGATTRR